MNIITTRCDCQYHFYYHTLPLRLQIMATCSNSNGKPELLCYLLSRGQIFGSRTVASNASGRWYVICRNRVTEMQQYVRVIDAAYWGQFSCLQDMQAKMWLHQFTDASLITKPVTVHFSDILPRKELERQSCCQHQPIISYSISFNELKVKNKMECRWKNTSFNELKVKNKKECRWMNAELDRK